MSDETITDEFEVIEGDFTVNEDDDENDAPPWHAVLQVWRDVLASAETEIVKKVTPQWAARIAGSYLGVELKDMNTFRDIYYGRMLELRDLVNEIIDAHPECLEVTTPQEDLAENSQHYRDLLLSWQLRFFQWELDWDCTSENAAVELAAFGEAHAFVFGIPGRTGLTAHMENIKLEITEADQASWSEALRQLREEHGE